MKVRNFEVILTDEWASIEIPDYMQGLQLENPEGNNPVEYRWGGGVVREIPAGAYSDWVCRDKSDPMRNEIEVKGTADEKLYGEFWVDNEQIEE